MRECQRSAWRAVSGRDDWAYWARSRSSLFFVNWFQVWVRLGVYVGAQGWVLFCDSIRNGKITFDNVPYEMSKFGSLLLDVLIDEFVTRSYG